MQNKFVTVVSMTGSR